MGPGDVTSREVVLRAMREYDELGRDAFLAKYGFGRSTKFIVVYDGRQYDSKALLAAAHGFQHPDLGPLLSNSFSGGDQTTSRLRALGFTIASPSIASTDVRFHKEDCQLFRRYPRAVPWRDENVNPADQALFKSVWQRLAKLAEWLRDSTGIDIPLRAFASRYQANGHTQRDIWCCIYPAQVSNKSYALQIALLVSAAGAEVCLCLGAGRSHLHGPKLVEAEGAFQRLQERLAAVPPVIVDALTRNLPSNVAYSKSWRQYGVTSDFRTLTDWLSFAASQDGAQSSISLYIDADELERLGPRIGDVVLQFADASAPLLEYCYPETPDDAGSRNSAVQQVFDFDDVQAADSEELEEEVEVDSLGRSTGVERENPSEEAIKEPFDRRR